MMGGDAAEVCRGMRFEHVVFFGRLGAQALAMFQLDGELGRWWPCCARRAWM